MLQKERSLQNLETCVLFIKCIALFDYFVIIRSLFMQSRTAEQREHLITPAATSDRYVCVDG